MLRRLSPALLAILLLAGAGCHEEPAEIAAVEGLPDGADPYLRHLATRCDGGSGRHCWYLGFLYRLGGGGLRADAERATAFFERTCGPLGVYGCQEAGEARKAAGDDAGAVERWDRGCRGGRVRPCMSILKLHEAREVP